MSTESFIFVVFAYENYLYRVEAPSEEVMNAMLKKVDCNDIWEEYNVPGMEKICLLGGKNIGCEFDIVIEVLKEFTYTQIEASSSVTIFMTQGHDLEEEEEEEED